MKSKNRIQVYPSDEIKAKIAEMAKATNRSESNMAEMLLQEAIWGRTAAKNTEVAK